MGAVVQVALDPPARLVAGGDDPRPRRHELRAALDVGDRRGDQLAEVGQALLRAGRQRTAPRASHERTPHPPEEHHRGDDPRHDALGVDEVVEVGPDGRVLVYPCRATAEHLLMAGRRAWTPGALPDAHDVRLHAGARDDGGQPIRVEPTQNCEIQVQEPVDLVGDRGEDLGRRRRARDERRHAPQRRLLVSKLREPLTVLARILESAGQPA